MSVNFSISDSSIAVSIVRSLTQSVTVNVTDAPMGGGGGAVGTTWDAAKKSSAVTLSDGDLVAASAGTPNYAGALSTTSHSTGKRCFKAILNGTVDVSELYGEVYAGVATSAFDLDSDNAQTAQSVLLSDFGHVDTAFGGAVGSNPGLVQQEGEAMFCFVNFDTGQIWFANESGPSGDPEAGTGESVAFTPNTEFFIACYIFSGSPPAPSTVTLDPTYSSGTFAAWDA